MSSTCISRSPSADARPLDFDDERGWSTNHLPTTTAGSNLLLPLDHSQTPRNSASDRTLDDHYRLDDERFRTGFEPRIISTQPGDGAFSLTDLPLHPTNGHPLETSHTPTYSLGPSPANTGTTPSPNFRTNTSKQNSTAVQQELSTGPYNPQLQSLGPLPRPSSTNLQSERGESRRASATDAYLDTMAGFGEAHDATNPQWVEQQMQVPQDTLVDFGGKYGYTGSAEPFDPFNDQFSTHLNGPDLLATGQRDDEGVWEPNERTGQAGLDPGNRALMQDVEVPSLKQQEEQRRTKEKNKQVQDWRAETGHNNETNKHGAERESLHTNPEDLPLSARSDDFDEGEDIMPVDDAASIRQNKLIEGQVYFNFKNTLPTEADSSLMHQPRHWHDPPALPYMTTTILQPQTANDAIHRWNVSADTISLSSRVATWGTRRRTEPTLADMDAIADGSFLKKLSISKSKEPDRHRSNSFLDHGLVRLASIVRNAGGGSIHKRSRSSQIVPESHPNTATSSEVATPSRSPSLKKRFAPSINTAFGSIATPSAAVGTTSTRNSSISTQASPKSPGHRGFARTMIQRARSRSEMSQHDRAPPAGLADLWRGQGGPPVANLAQPHPEANTYLADVYDRDEEEDEYDDQRDVRKVKIEAEHQSGPIVPTLEGFEAHARGLNPNMSPEFDWLVDRIACQQEARYKNLLDLRADHLREVAAGTCANGHLCMAQGGSSSLLDADGNTDESNHFISGLQIITSLPNNSNPKVPALTEESFPLGVPKPTSQNSPVEFECQLCFKHRNHNKPSDWTKHIYEDLQPFTCTLDGCKESKPFKRKADWVRHENERHRHLETWTCQIGDCRHRCFRKDNFVQHLVREHSYSEPRQRPTPSPKDKPTWDMVESCHQETQNKPQDEPCKFCGKVFTTWRKLSDHLADHMERLSLPILRLVHASNVDANTMVSPARLATPVTPHIGTKKESISPFNMDGVSPYVPTTQQFPPFDLVATMSSPAYGLQAPIPQGVNSSPGMVGSGVPSPYHMDQHQMYSNPFGSHYIDQSTMHSNAFDSYQTNQHPLYPNTFDPNQLGPPLIEHSVPDGFGNMNQPNGLMPPQNTFSHNLSGQEGYGPHQPNGHQLVYNPGSDNLPASGYQVPSVPVTSNPTSDFNSLAMSSNQGFQQAPNGQAQKTTPLYEHQAQKFPLDMSYYDIQ